MKRKMWIAGLLVLLIAISAGCGQKPQVAPAPEQPNEISGAVTDGGDTEANSPGQNNSNQSPNAGSTEPDNDVITTSIETYFTDDQMMDLIKESKKITYKQENDKYLTALQALQSSDTQLFSLWGKMQFQSANLKDGQLTIDMTLPDEARLGAGGESLALDALKQTIFQFSEVQSIELLVDGVQVDTLMGHVELEHPMKRN